MNNDSFIEWLNRIDYADGNKARSIIHMCELIESCLNIDLDEEIEKDMGSSLITLFDYSFEDEENNKPVPEKVSELFKPSPLRHFPVNILDKMACYKYSLLLYSKYYRTNVLHQLHNDTHAQLSGLQSASIKRIYDAFIDFIYKCLPEGINKNTADITLSDYYYAFRKKAEMLTNKGMREDMAASEAAWRIFNQIKKDRSCLIPIIEKERFPLWNTEIYIALKDYYEDELCHIVEESDFTKKNEKSISPMLSELATEFLTIKKSDIFLDYSEDYWSSDDKPSYSERLFARARITNRRTALIRRLNYIIDKYCHSFDILNT